VLDAPALEWLKAHAAQVFAKMDCVLLACDGQADHLHLLIEHPPDLSVSALVNAFKATSSRGLHKARPVIAARHRDVVLWSPSYFAASTGCAPLENVEQCVQQQRASSSP
jgi:putative transposase